MPKDIGRDCSYQVDSSGDSNNSITLVKLEGTDLKNYCNKLKDFYDDRRKKKS